MSSGRWAKGGESFQDACGAAGGEKLQSDDVIQRRVAQCRRASPIAAGSPSGRISEPSQIIQITDGSPVEV